MTTSEPIWLPAKSAEAPISGGMTAPPQTPVIISPEISLALSGWLLSAARIDYREDARAGEADQSDQHQHTGRCVGEPEDDHGGNGREDMDSEVADIAHAHEQERADQCADRAADEVDARSDSGLFDGVSAALDKQLRSHRIHADIDAYDEDDAQKENQHRAVLEQREGRTRPMRPAVLRATHGSGCRGARGPTAA